MKRKEKYTRSDSGWQLIEKSKYRGVAKYRNAKMREFWIARISKTKKTNNRSKSFDTEREAAMQIDLWRIGYGLEPVNILKRK